MSCSGATGFSEAATAMSDALAAESFVQAFTCLYANATGGLVVMGTMLWFAIVTMSFVRTGSFAMPLVFTLVLGGAALAQVAGPVLGIASVLVLGGVSVIILLVARRMETV